MFKLSTVSSIFKPIQASLGAVLAIFIQCNAFGQSSPAPVNAAPQVTTAADDGKWEPKVKVLQNRYFIKGLRPEVSLFGGTLLNESYSQTWIYGSRIGMFLNESLGAELTYKAFSSTDSPDLKALQSLEYCNGTTCTHPEPAFTRLNRAISLTGTFAPIYGKINLLDWVILYSDIYVNAGFSSLNVQQEPAILGANKRNKISPLLSVGQRFYFAKSFNIRVDAEDHIFSEERIARTGDKKTAWKHAWTVSVGFSAFVSQGRENQ